MSSNIDGQDTSTQDAIIDVLAHLQPQPPSPISHDPVLTSHPTSDGLDGWRVADLRAEIVRLREILRGYGHTDLDPPFEARKAQRARDHGVAMNHVGQEAEWTMDGVLEPRSSRKAKRSRASTVGKDGETGKRLTKPRRHELQSAIRNKMRFAMGIGENDPLPAPTMFSTAGSDQLPELAGYGVPNWVTMNDPCNATWIERMAAELLEEAGNGDHHQIPADDLDPEIVKSAAKTAFINFAKKFMEENDPRRASQKEKYQKLRRRWARKDLKQKKRAKAAADPACTDTVPAVALHIDYMSSECSTQGEDSDPEGTDEYTKAARTRRWTEQIATKAAEAPAEQIEGKVWGKAQGEKVLEIRTPRWRSAALNEIYSRLDQIAAVHSADRAGPDRKAQTRTPKAGHVAPSHSRFVLEGDLARRGKKPKEDGEGWMWKSGQVGVWPVHGGEMNEYSLDHRGEDVGGDWREEETGALVNALQGIAE